MSFTSGGVIYLTPAEAVGRLPFPTTEWQLMKLRKNGQGPAYIQPTGPRGAVFYPEDEITSWGTARMALQPT